MDGFGILLLWAGLAFGVGMLADSRGRSWVGFFFLALVLSPLLGLIIVLVMSDLNVERFNAEEQKREHERQLASIRAIATPLAETQRQAVAAVAAAAPVSVADELTKLADLQAKGILSGEEFAVQKARLLQAYQ